MTSTRLPKTITAGALLATPIPPVKWIIPGLLPAGLAIFAGPSKAGKSWLTLWLCLQISQGKSVWGRETEPRTVLYFSLEDTLGRLQERLYQLVDAEEDPERLILQTESHGIGQGLEEQIVSFIHAYPDISLIVIDTLQKVRKSDQNGSMYANDYKDIGALKELADKYGICILLVHHLRKQSSSDPYDQISGSTGIMGVAGQTMRGRICEPYRNALVKQTAWWRSMPTRVSAKGRSPRSNVMRSAWHWPARSGASVSKCWSPLT